MFTGPDAGGDEREKSSVIASPRTARSSATVSRAHRGIAILIEQRHEAPFAEIERVELAVEVTPVRGPGPRIRRHDVDDVLVQSSRADQLHRRQPHAFLIAFGRLRIVAAGHVATDVEPMSDRGQPTEHAAVAVDRPHQPKIVEMRAAVIGIVEDISVAGSKTAVACHLVDHRLHREGHGADEDRQAQRPLHQRRAGLRVVEAVAGVTRLGDDRIERGAVERRVHLVGDLLEPPLQDRQGDGINGDGTNRAHAASSSRAPAPLGGAAS
jgi:hypothetical protein